MSGQRIMRVIVRGRFADLNDRALEYLKSNLDQHDIANAKFTREGDFTYDSRIEFFSIRYESRVAMKEPDGLAAEYSVNEAKQFLRVMGFEHGRLSATVSDVAAAWGRRQADALSRSRT
jgi:uncharacterized protein DUF6204